MTKILLADDSVTIQKVVELTFADQESEVTAVSDGAAALEKAQLQKPDIILSDVVMPGMSGYELCQTVKSDPNLKNIPFLFLKGTFESFDEEKARECGADGFIVKPFESQELISKVQELVSAPVPAAEAPAPAPEPAAEPAAPPEPAPPPPAFPSEPEVPAAAAEPAVPVPPPVQEPAASLPPPPAPEPAMPAADPFADEPPAAAPPEESFDLSEEDLMEEDVAAPGPEASAPPAPAPAPEPEQEEDLWSEVSLRESESPLVEDKVLEDESFWGTPEEIAEPEFAEPASGEDLLEEVSESEDFGFGETPVESSEPPPAPEAPPTAADPFFTAPPGPPPAPPLEDIPEAEIVAPEPEPASEPVPEFIPEPEPEPVPEPVSEPVPEPPAMPERESAREAPIQETVAPVSVSPSELEKAVSAKIEDAVRGILGPAFDEAAKKIVEEVAWEIIPDLAEAMIRSEIERIKAENS